MVAGGLQLNGQGSGSAILECRDLAVSFGGVVALKGVDLAVPPGDVLGVIGPNGSGKTSLVNLVSGYYQPTAGSIHFAGQRIDGLRPQQIRALGIARTFQNLRLFDDLTVLENIEVAMAIDLASAIGVTRASAGAMLWRRQRKLQRAARERAVKLLEENGFTGLLDVRAGSLSYGQRKELELLRALAEPPQLLLLDEPTSGVSRAEAEEVRSRIALWRERTACTLLIVEHRLGWLFGLAERIIVLGSGSVIAEGSPEMITSDPGVRKAYVGTRHDH
jgi:ABC-type branched-subunit amino acid transport system ATPase component